MRCARDYVDATFKLSKGRYLGSFKEWADTPVIQDVGKLTKASADGVEFDWIMEFVDNALYTKARFHAKKAGDMP